MWYHEVQLHLPVDASYFLTWHLIRLGLGCGDACIDVVGGGTSDNDAGVVEGDDCEDDCGTNGNWGEDDSCTGSFRIKLKCRCLGGLPGPLFTGVCTVAGDDMCTDVFPLVGTGVCNSALPGALSGAPLGMFSDEFDVLDDAGTSMLSCVLSISPNGGFSGADGTYVCAWTGA